ncbi:MerR family transcriptional regulator [Kribbella sandramycini]|uniref:DNA-binding transcriptional MerR regulator n=1 Tax=Kribbella sandramycini TaxID=60450 RepID=A0A7Y4L6E3_9ACTN|nr:DNA-binding transcriptional MerR regulator [Kribbella sandramycini]NOL44156.1 MerR family transcriptional regulator [Kribbella sandramycini]
MERTVSEVAKLAGVSVRTLRHYDAIGLLPPGYVAPNGYRYYGRPELLRLQRILLLRELDVALPEIARILAEPADELAALRGHREQLERERRRLDGVIGVVDRTIEGLSGDDSIGDEEFFVGLTAARDRLEADLTDRFGPEVGAAFEEAVRATDGWSRDDYERMADEGRRLLLRMSAARARGVVPDSPEALELTELHYQGVLELWPADATGYYNLGAVLLDNPEQRAMIASVDPELPPWLSAAVQAYAVRKLGYRIDKKTVDGPV